MDDLVQEAIACIADNTNRILPEHTPTWVPLMAGLVCRLQAAEKFCNAKRDGWANAEWMGDEAEEAHAAWRALAKGRES